MAYDSLEELKNDGSYYSKDSSFRRGRQDWDGEEAYPILVSTVCNSDLYSQRSGLIYSDYIDTGEAARGYASESQDSMLRCCLENGILKKFDILLGRPSRSKAR